LTEHLRPVNVCVLSIICFNIGGSLKKDTLKTYSRQFALILLAGSLIPFLCVAFLTGFSDYALTADKNQALAVGLLLGSIATATAPASITVLKENRAKGPLTTIMQGVIAMDDLVCLVFYAASTAFIDIRDGGAFSFQARILSICKTIFFPALTGVGTGFLLRLFICRREGNGRLTGFMLGTVFLTAGICELTGFNIILAANVMGLCTINGPGRGETLQKNAARVMHLVDYFTPPMFCLFFTQIGATIDLVVIMKSLRYVGLLCLFYILGRSLGKMGGVALGTRLSHASKTLCKYLPFCVLNQAGVALGLASTILSDYAGSIGQEILLIITIATVVVQVIGPLGVRYAIIRAGECGKA
jgi:Kef-type K+ transport system membrane component KefB